MKPDSASFLTFLKNLRAQPWLTAEQRWWTHYLFHFAEIHNVVSILKSNEILCRVEAEKKAGFFHSTSTDVLDHTASRWKEHVRFYFRPRTPTFWHVEGFRPAEVLARSRFPNAHCPIPIYLLFSLDNIICRSDSVFSNGNLARSDTKVSKLAEDFESLLFHLIYHDGSFSHAERDEIISRRQAEVIIPQRMGLENLEYICCRSQAEYETLMHMLPDERWNYWRNRILVQTDFNLFNRKRGFVDEALLSSKRLHFRFNPCDSWEDRGPFKAKVTILESHTSNTYTWHDDNFRFLPNDSLTINLSKLTHPDDYIVTFTLDNQLAYRNRFQEYDIPF